MSSGGAQANKFYQQVAENKALWFASTVEGNALEFDVRDNKVSLPLWSSKSRILRLKKLNPELLAEYIPVEITWDFFIKTLVPQLNSKNRIVGVNLSGKNITGFDMSIEDLVFQVEAFF